MRSAYRYGEGVALDNLGAALLDLGRPDGGGRSSANGPARTFDEISYLARSRATPCTTSGRCYQALGRDQDALDCLRQALEQSSGHRGTGIGRGSRCEPSARSQAGHGLAAEARRSWARGGGDL